MIHSGSFFFILPELSITNTRSSNGRSSLSAAADDTNCGIMINTDKNAKMEAVKKKKLHFNLLAILFMVFASLIRFASDFGYY